MNIMKKTSKVIFTKSLAFAAGIALALICAVAPLHAQRHADPQKLANPDSFSMILLGDPQGYTKYDINQPIFELCTAWISDNISRLNIKAVLCTGDLVEQNENIILNRKMLNQTSREMWQSASRSLARLDNKVPYIVSCGNHDYGYRSSENGMTRFPEYFPIERNSTWRDTCVAALPNRNGIPSLENAAFEFSDEKWGRLLVITSEFHPRNEVLDWAKKLASSKKYENHTVIFMTHSFLTNGKDSRRIEKEKYKLIDNNGADIWEKLIRSTPNIRLVICGHTANGKGKFEDNVSYRADANDAGKTVHQMMFNVQTLGGGWEGNGGDGWLRILEFLPDGKTIAVRTYSPLFGISPSTKHLAHRTEPFDQFEMTIER
ncbi:metallophosphoesterase [Ereboglobus sp. PH5-10]|uniref:metallophosphoesterase n=2 Tax=unclassified Ereboglobus TaxID=2626932 RepID=UPI002405FB78|nr:metallophosphoesterase [Ereboglobus sp. PH5-10]